jgi:hypothetical protein
VTTTLPPSSTAATELFCSDNGGRERHLVREPLVREPLVREPLESRQKWAKLAW